MCLLMSVAKTWMYIEGARYMRRGTLSVRRHNVHRPHWPRGACRECPGVKETGTVLLQCNKGGPGSRLSSVCQWPTHRCQIPPHKRSGGWFNKKMPSYQYRKSHCGDKTILRPSYLHNGISYTGKMASLYWIRALSATLSHKETPHDLALVTTPKVTVKVITTLRPNVGREGTTHVCHHGYTRPQRQGTNGH